MIAKLFTMKLFSLCFPSELYFLSLFNFLQWRYKDKVGTFTVAGCTNTCVRNLFFSHEHPQYFPFLPTFSISIICSVDVTSILVKLNFQFHAKLYFIFLFCSLHAISLKKSALCDNTLFEHVHTRPNWNLYWNFAKQIVKKSEKRAWSQRNARENDESREELAESEPAKAERKVSGNFELLGFSPIPLRICYKLKVPRFVNILDVVQSKRLRPHDTTRRRMIHFAKCWPWIGQRTPLFLLLAQCFFIHEAYKEKCDRICFREINYSLMERKATWRERERARQTCTIIWWNFSGVLQLILKNLMKRKRSPTDRIEEIVNNDLKDI